MFKRITALLLCLCLLCLLAACKKKGKEDTIEVPQGDTQTTDSGTTEQGDTTDQNQNGNEAGNENGNGNTSGGNNETRIDPDTGEIVLPWVG